MEVKFLSLQKISTHTQNQCCQKPITLGTLLPSRAKVTNCVLSARAYVAGLSSHSGGVLLPDAPIPSHHTQPAENPKPE